VILLVNARRSDFNATGRCFCIGTNAMGALAFRVLPNSPAGSNVTMIQEMRGEARTEPLADASMAVDLCPACGNRAEMRRQGSMNSVLDRPLW
jgi:hypothetical protein